MKFAALTCLLALGCAAKPGPAAAPPELAQVDIQCGRYGHGVLMGGRSTRNGASDAPAFDAAQAAAERDVEAAELANEARDDRAAAEHFLACAQRYRAVPDADPLHRTARRNAMTCYRNTRWAYANAGLWASEGKAAFTLAVQEDPRHSAELEQMLATPVTECTRPGA
ncbi:MAG: hypothetical protein H0T76_21465 [Nannocystis sp.]|nr:hypothetical protein [Nannocystis sp.]MBA3549061.1 hypothetical protein [Nannocystis sp.]